MAAPYISRIGSLSPAERKREEERLRKHEYEQAFKTGRTNSTYEQWVANEWQPFDQRPGYDPNNPLTWQSVNASGAGMSFTYGGMPSGAGSPITYGNMQQFLYSDWQGLTPPPPRKDSPLPDEIVRAIADSETRRSMLGRTRKSTFTLNPILFSTLRGT